MGGEQSHDGEKKQDETKEKEESENPDSSRSAASEGNTCFQQRSWVHLLVPINYNKWFYFSYFGPPVHYITEGNIVLFLLHYSVKH